VFFLLQVKMAYGIVLCDFSSTVFPKVNVPDASELCLNSEAFKCKLLNIQDELKSAWFIIELLVNEVNNLKACSGANVLDSMTEDTNPTGLQKWILIKHTHSNSKKCTPTVQPRNLITLTNSFGVLGDLDDAPEKATSNLKMAPITTCVRNQRPCTSVNHSVIVMGDSHVRGISDRLSRNLGSSFSTTGCVKPNATLSYITSSETSELRKLSKSDVVILCGGSMDIARKSYAGACRCNKVNYKYVY